MNKTDVLQFWSSVRKVLLITFNNKTNKQQKIELDFISLLYNTNLLPATYVDHFVYKDR